MSRCTGHTGRMGLEVAAALGVQTGLLVPGMGSPHIRGGLSVVVGSSCGWTPPESRLRASQLQAPAGDRVWSDTRPVTR